MNERRLYSRVAFLAEGRLFLPDGEYPVQILDLSLKGALVHPLQALFVPIGSNCTLKLRLGDAGATIRMEATLVHRAGERYGLACREIDVDSVTHLRRLIALNLGDESLAERELSHLSLD